MPQLTIVDHGAFDIPAGTRLVLAIEDSGFDILHRCGGFARCTTCRVDFLEGEPDQMTEAEMEKLESKGELGNFRLSCQCEVMEDMVVRPHFRLSTSEHEDPGPRPEDTITPEPVWLDEA